MVKLYNCKKPRFIHLNVVAIHYIIKCSMTYRLPKAFIIQSQIALIRDRFKEVEVINNFIEQWSIHLLNEHIICGKVFGV